LSGGKEKEEKGQEEKEKELTLFTHINFHIEPISMIFGM